MQQRFYMTYLCINFTYALFARGSTVCDDLAFRWKKRGSHVSIPASHWSPKCLQVKKPPGSSSSQGPSGAAVRHARP